MSKVSVKVTSDTPPSNAEWNVDIENSDEALVYTNAIYDLIAAVVAKAGLIMSEYRITGELPRAQAEMKALQKRVNDFDE
jgi:hypothetical protein